jgi:hypothetical protein
MSRDFSDVYEAIRTAESENRPDDVKKLTEYLNTESSKDVGEPVLDKRDLKSTLGGAAIGSTTAVVGVPFAKAGIKEISKSKAGVPVVGAFDEVPQARSAFERTIQGGMDEASGTTGRARQTAYNEFTHGVSERAKAQQQVLKELSDKGIIGAKKLASAADTVGYGATPSGVLVRPEALAAEAKAMPMGQKITQGIKSLPQDIAAFGKGVANYRLPIIGSVGPMIGRSLAGAGAGIQGVDAMNRFAQDDYLGGTISGIGSVGSSAMLLPHPIAKGAGFAVGAGAEALNAYLDYLKQKVQQPAQPQQQPAPEQEQFAPQAMAQGGQVGGLNAIYNMPLAGGSSLSIGGQQPQPMQPGQPMMQRPGLNNLQ